MSRISFFSGFLIISANLAVAGENSLSIAIKHNYTNPYDDVKWSWGYFEEGPIIDRVIKLNIDQVKIYNDPKILYDDVLPSNPLLDPEPQTLQSGLEFTRQVWADAMPRIYVLRFVGGDPRHFVYKLLTIEPNAEYLRKLSFDQDKFVFPPSLDNSSPFAERVRCSSLYGLDTLNSGISGNVTGSIQLLNQNGEGVTFPLLFIDSRTTLEEAINCSFNNVEIMMELTPSSIKPNFFDLKLLFNAYGTDFMALAKYECGSRSSPTPYFKFLDGLTGCQRE